MKKVIISGGPHTGKTTLFNELKKRFPSSFFITEPASNVIKYEKKKEEEQKNYIGKFPWNNYSEFGSLVIDESLKLENNIPKNVKLVILDRSLIDTIAYAKIEKCLHFIPSLMKLIKSSNYDTVLFCDFVGKYSSTKLRHEDESKAILTHKLLLEAYENVGLKIFHIPNVSIKKRVRFVSKILEK